MTKEMMKKEAVDFLDGIQGELFGLSDFIWDHPEIAFNEFESAGRLGRWLTAQGFCVEMGLAGMPTAFKATFGSGRPVIGILGEFDALDGMSQEAGIYEKSSVKGQSLGHGCGHHALGSAAAAGAAAIKNYLLATKKSGTVIYFGCPGEEGGSGKSFMVRDGIFDGVDCALTWHPGDHTGLFTGRCLANISATYRFTGVSAHAAGLAHLGRSALDAVELMNVGANYLREHMVPDARIHYAVLDTGGISPNVVQAHAAVYYYMRAPLPGQVKELYQRVCDIAKGAALMTGTTVEVTYNRGVSSLMPNRCLNEVMHQNMTAIPLPQYSSEEHEQAGRMRATIQKPEETFEEMLAPMNREERAKVLAHRGEDIYNFVVPVLQAEPLLFGSTDVGDVSMVCPVAQLHAAAYAAGTPLHSWQAVAQGKSSLMHQGELYAAKVLACTAIDLFEEPKLVEMAQAELEERLGDEPYEPLMPKDVKPQLKRV